MDTTSLFNEDEDTDSASTPDVLVSPLDSDNDNLGASDVLMSQNLDENNDDCDYNQTISQIKDLQELIRYPMYLDETLLYSIDDQDEVESTSHNKEKRTRKRPTYLGDYVQ